MLGLCFCAKAFSSCGKQGPLFIVVRGPLTVADSLVGSTGSRCAGSVVVAHGPSCSAACGIFPDQGSNPCSLHWQADSQPLRHQGSPLTWILKGILDDLFISNCLKASWYIQQILNFPMIVTHWLRKDLVFSLFARFWVKRTGNSRWYNQGVWQGERVRFL